MAKNKKKFNIDNRYYLCGPLALVSFFLLDVIGGFNFPGFDWISNVIADLTALNSYSLVISLVFSIIFALLITFSGICVWKFIKGLKFNNLLKKGLKLFIIASMVFSLGTTIFLQPESGTYQTIKDNAIITTKDEPIEDEEGNVTETQEVIDMDATTESFSKIAETISNPLMIGNLASVILSFVLAIIALILSIIGGFKKKGHILFGAASIFCIIMIFYSIFSFFAGETSMIGLNTRFACYAIVLFAAFESAYVYITNIQE